MTTVAVVIVTWNSAKLIRKVLEALEQQTFKPNRVLVVDNASDDQIETVSIVKSFPSVEWMALSANLGFAAANNLAFQRCTDSDFIALLNPDAFPTPEWLEKLVTAASNNPQFASFASRLLCHDKPELLDGAGDKMNLFGKPRRRGHKIAAKTAYLDFEPIFCPSAAAAMYRNNALTKVGGFDEDFFCYMEDVDLGFRLLLAGYSAAYVPDAIAYHVGSATTGGQHSDFSVYHGHRNLIWTFVKNMPGCLFWWLLPLHLLLNLATIVFFALAGQGKVILRAKADALKSLPDVWAKRQAIQGRRVVPIMHIWHLLDKPSLPFTRN